MEVLQKVYKVMDGLSCDAIMISDPYNMRYITGYCGDTGIAVITKKEGVIFTDFRYIYQAIKEAKNYRVIDVLQEGYATAIAKYLKESDVTTVAFQQDEVRYSQYMSFKRSFDAINLIPYTSELDDLRMVKTPEELEKLRRAEEIGDIAFREILKDLKPGVTELEIAAKLEYLLKTNGGEGISFDPIVASGVNSSMPHAVPSRKKIELGDFVTMDFGCKYEGYCSDMTRTVVVGKASEKQKEIYQVVLTAQLAVLEQLKAGMKGFEIDQIARDIIDQAGYEGCFGHGLGHSVGLFIHESPRASMAYQGLVLENMIMTVEPGIYVKDFGGVRIEDMVVVTKEGHINFAKSPKELIEL